MAIPNADFVIMFIASFLMPRADDSHSLAYAIRCGKTPHARLPAARATIGAVKPSAALKFSSERRSERIGLARMVLRLRYVSVLVQLATIAYARHRIGLELPYAALYATVAGIAVFNLVSHVWLRHRDEVGVPALLGQLGFDALALSVLLYLSGGPANPFVSLFLVPIALATGALDFVATLGLAALSCILYAVLIRHHVPLLHVHGIDFDLHLTGMWVNFVLSTCVLVAVLGRLSQQLHEQRRRIAELRERALRDEAVLALGTLAAATAHELNTPLTTLGLLIDEAEVEPDAADFAAMRTALRRCHTHVTTLVRLARGEHAESIRTVSIDALIEAAIEPMRLLHGDIRFDCTIDAVDAFVRSDTTLVHAIANLLDNAAKATRATCANAVDVCARKTGQDVISIDIADRGPGVAEGSELVPAGLGVGLLLSNASVERFGGEVRRAARAGGGCITSVRLLIVGVER
jgi:two-component system sensor histidine kinase RegB